MKQELFDVAEAGDILKITPAKVMWLVRAGLLHYEKLNASRRPLFAWHHLANYQIESIKHIGRYQHARSNR